MLPTPSHFRPESLLGTTLDSRYRLVAHIASGGMGSVYRAEHVYMRKDVAVKLLRPDLSSLPDIVERFRREAEIAAALEHENIVRVTDFGRSPEGWLFLAMELLEGKSLFERLRGSLRMAPEEALPVLIQMCRGLDAAHARGVVHRDLKPENVFLLTRPPGLVKILDFGIAKLTDPKLDGETQVGMVVGTPEYLSPEQAMGTAVDGRSDVYGVGLIGWRMLAGHHPFKADDARGLLMMQASQPVPSLLDVRPDLAAWPGLVGAIARACAKDVGQRHQSVMQLCVDLEKCLEAMDPAAVDRVLRLPSRTQLPRITPPLPVEPQKPIEATLTLVPEGGSPRLQLRNAAAIARARWLAVAIVLLVALAVPGWLVLRWIDERPVAQVKSLLDSQRPGAARELLQTAIARRPADARLRVLQGRALHRIDGQAGAGVKAYAQALDLDPRSLDGDALVDLTRDLGADRVTADQAAQVLQKVGEPAVPYIASATRIGPGFARLRALELARVTGASGQIDPTDVYTSLLDDPECEVRQIAARRLGEIGSEAALPRLHEVARDQRRMIGLLGVPKKVPACAAREAEVAIRKIEGG